MLRCGFVSIANGLGETKLRDRYAAMAGNKRRKAGNERVLFKFSVHDAFIGYKIGKLPIVSIDPSSFTLDHCGWSADKVCTKVNA